MEELKSIKLQLLYPNEDGTTTSKEMVIKVNTPKLKDRAAQPNSYHNPQNFVYQLSFSLKIPDHIHSALLGESVPEIGGFGKMKTYEEKDFPKTINRENIEALTAKWAEIVQGYCWLKQMEKAELIKVIFFSLDSSSNIHQSSWNSTKFGIKTKISSTYYVGYVRGKDKKEIRYTIEKRVVNNHYDKEFYEYKYVEWTADRELFFNNIQSTFENIAQKMKNFESGLNEESIASIMSSNYNLLGS